MQKKLIAMAIGAAIAAAPLVAAQADVKLRGMMQVEGVNLDGGDFNNKWEMGDSGARSRVFIDASKDLGNGMKAFGRYAWKLNPSNGEQFAARDQYVGLKGGFGAVLFGRMPTPYKMYGGVKWDPYAASFLEARRSGGMSGDALGHNSFVNDVAAYASPVWGGVKFTVGYIFDENATAGGTKPAANGSVVSGISGNWGPIEVIGAYTNFRNRAVGDIAGGKDVKQAKVGVRYKGNGLTAAWQYEDVDASGSIRVNGNKVGSGGAAKINFVNLGYKFGNTLITGSYGNTNAQDGGQDVDYWMIGATYFLAKKVRTYIGYASTDLQNAVLGGSTKYKMLGAGMRYDF